jgi:DUF1009 family protein
LEHSGGGAVNEKQKEKWTKMFYKRAEEARVFLKVWGCLSDTENENVLKRIKRTVEKNGFRLVEKEENS